MPDVCNEAGKRIQELRHLRGIKEVELASYLNIGKINCHI